MENKGHKENTCEEKNIFPPKMASENAFKKCGFQILKFKIQQKVLNKNDAECLKKDYIKEKPFFGCLKIINM